MICSEVGLNLSNLLNPVYQYSTAVVKNYHESSGLNNMNLISYSSVGQDSDTTMPWIGPSSEWQDF